MIIVYDGGVGKFIRPCPLISINFNSNKNKIGSLGGTYDITLTGTILDDEGSPYNLNGGQVNSIDNPSVLSTQYDPRPASEFVPYDLKLGAILQKQNAIRKLFSKDGQKIEVCSINGGDPIITFFPTVTSISFEEGIYINTAKYTINLQAPVLFDRNNNVLSEGKMGLAFEPDRPTQPYPYLDSEIFNDNTPQSIEAHLNDVGGFVEDFSDNWSIEIEDGNGNTLDGPNAPLYTKNIVRAYRLTRNLSATGKVIYAPGNGDLSKRYEAWEQARSFINKKILHTHTYADYPRPSIDQYFASGLLNLPSGAFSGYNHSRTEAIDKTAGTVSVSETWLLSSGTALENFNMSIGQSIDDPLQTISINGTIKGLTAITPSGSIYGGSDNYSTPPSQDKNTPYANATIKYNIISNSGQFGYNSVIYKRITNASLLPFNPIPKSVNLGLNEFTGEITYDMTFDTRPCNFIEGTLAENISVNDTYPGDVFAIIPVLGRSTGPVLQYLGSRTEYKRDATIDLLFSPYLLTSGNNCSAGALPYPNANNDIPVYRYRNLLLKPSLHEPYRSRINNLIASLSPAFETGIRKFFLNPPTESWSPKEGRYTISLSWVYELDH
ncbi:hypothetical protein EB001_04870 [bacterium]|nr:hypothetical protein [bacterium]